MNKISEFEWILGFSAEEITLWMVKSVDNETLIVIEALIAMADD